MINRKVLIDPRPLNLNPDWSGERSLFSETKEIVHNVIN